MLSFKIFSFALLVISCFAPMNAQAPSTENIKHEADQNSKLERYYSGDKRFSVAFPKDWEFSGSPDGAALQGVRSKDQGPHDEMREYMMVGSNEIGSKTTLADYVKFTIDSFKKEAPSTVTVSSENIKIDNVDATKVIYTSMTGDNLPFKSVQIFMIKDDRGYYIAGIAHMDSFDTYAPIFDEVTKSFRFEKQ